MSLIHLHRISRHDLINLSKSARKWMRMTRSSSMNSLKKLTEFGPTLWIFVVLYLSACLINAHPRFRQKFCLYISSLLLISTRRKKTEYWMLYACYVIVLNLEISNCSMQSILKLVPRWLRSLTLRAKKSLTLFKPLFLLLVAWLSVVQLDNLSSKLRQWLSLLKYSRMLSFSQMIRVVCTHVLITPCHA